MKLEFLELENFRQFFGSQKITFALAEDRNVTVVYGANGSGKTTLLNAFTWCLYGLFTPAFEHPESLVNERALSSSDDSVVVSAKVTIRFSHEDNVYFMSRERSERRNAAGHNEKVGADKVQLLVQRPSSGTTEALGNPADAMKQILPERLYGFFFIDGERVERIAKPSAYEEIEDAIKTVLGLEVLERAISDLPNAKRLINAEAKSLGNIDNGEIKELADQAEKADEHIDALENERAMAVANRAALQTSLDVVHSQLRALDSAKDLQERREGIEEQERLLKAQLDNTRQSVARLVNRRGYLAFAAPLVEKTLEMAEANRAKGELPAPIQRQFVEDLLAEGHCICGTELTEGSVPRRNVTDWVLRGGTAEIESGWASVSAYCSSFRMDRADLFRSLETQLGELAVGRRHLSGLEEQLSEVSRALDGIDSGPVKDLIATRDDLIASIETTSRQIWDLERRTEQALGEKADIELRQESAKTSDVKVRLIQKRKKAIDRVGSALEEIFKLRKADVRRELDERIKNFYREIAFKPYVPEVTAEFQVRLRKSLGGEDIAVAKGQGENQLLSLSFVGALAKLARDKYNQRSKQAKNQLFSYQGGVYPIVMDSPFGALDENYRRDVAHAIPLLAPQVIVFVSKSQGLGVVGQELEPHVGAQYVVAYHTPKDDASEEQIEINDGTWPYIVKSHNEYEWATLVSIKS